MRRLAPWIGKVETSGSGQPDPPHRGLGEPTPAGPHDVQLSRVPGLERHDGPPLRLGLDGPPRRDGPLADSEPGAFAIHDHQFWLASQRARLAAGVDDFERSHQVSLVALQANGPSKLDGLTRLDRHLSPNPARL